jgi:TonB family protein
MVFGATRQEKQKYRFAAPTVMTVTDHGGPAVLHAPPVVYPPQALRNGVEGRVTLKVKIAPDGTVMRAVPVAGPVPLQKAAVENVRHWQFEAKAQETEVAVEFSIRLATHSIVLPEPLYRRAPIYQGRLRGSVRVVAMVGPEGRVEFVQPVTGPEELAMAAVECVRKWRFRPLLRNGKPEFGTAVIDVAVGL